MHNMESGLPYNEIVEQKEFGPDKFVVQATAENGIFLEFRF